MIHWVEQQDKYGCGCAAVAMLTGLTYEEVKHYVGDRFSANRGLDSGAWCNVLAEKGFAVAGIYRVRQYPWQNCARDTWPPPPWADQHLCEVIVGSGGHMVVMLADGVVLDPLTPEPKQLTDYAQVFWVGAVVPAPRPPARLLATHRQPEMEFNPSRGQDQ